MTPRFRKAGSPFSKALLHKKSLPDTNRVREKFYCFLGKRKLIYTIATTTTTAAIKEVTC